MSDFAVITEGMAAELGLVIVEPLEDVLQLDIDTGAQRDQYEIQRRVLESVIPILQTVETVSKSGKAIAGEKEESARQGRAYGEIFGHMEQTA